jgi:TonB family protein
MDLHNGTVIVDLVIAKGGKLIDVVVVRPSGFEEFDQNVVTRFKGADTFDPVPDKVSMGPSITIRVPVFGGFKAP